MRISEADHGYVPIVVIVIRSFPHSWLIARFVTRSTQKAPHVEQRVPTTPECVCSPPVCFSSVSVAQSLVFCVEYLVHCLYCCPFYFWPLYCMPVSNLRPLITPLVSSSISWEWWSLSMHCDKQVSDSSLCERLRTL